MPRHNTPIKSRPKKKALVTPCAVSSAMPEAPAQATSLVVSNVSPCLEGGRYPIKCTLGDSISIEADIFQDGHGVVLACIQWRRKGDEIWHETPMLLTHNDRWLGSFTLPQEGSTVAPGFFEYRVCAWGDAFLSWCEEVGKKYAAAQADMTSEILEGVALLQATSSRAQGKDATRLASQATALAACSLAALPDFSANADLQKLVVRYPDRSLETVSTALRLWADRSLATCAAWYEFFPRSAEGKADSGSRFRDCIERVEDAQTMGFDVIYFPPIHPIGETKRKGANNSLVCKPGEPGVPYAIGNRKQGVNGGGHKDVAPELGTIEDFDWLVGEVRARGMEVAIDFAINCSPDHPYVHEHPDWFFKRPDGSIKFAENPPKKYEDVFPLNFYNADWRNLWKELYSIIAFWCEHGVRIFRVDNPHTKPMVFWEWMIAEIQVRWPDAIFLSEAFTRPKVMQTLAKAGYTQSYTYFTWRNNKEEIQDYLKELTTSEMKHYFRPNFFANTPDILPEFLQKGGKPAFCIRAILAATLSPLYGIYSGFELCENTPVPSKEEYLNSEKYQFKARDWNAPGNIKPLVTRLNSIRRKNPAFHELANLQFHRAENDHILFYSKRTADEANNIFVAISHDAQNLQTAFVYVPYWELGIRDGEPYLMEDLLTGEKFRWSGERNFVALNPESRPAHIFRLRRFRGNDAHGNEVWE